MYIFKLGDLMLPVAPEKFEEKIKNQNNTITLINGENYNFLRPPGLTEISFDVLIPAVKYPFAVYEDGFKDQKYYLDALKKLKTEQESFTLSISRELPDGRGLYDTEMEVSLEDYAIKEQAKEGFDLIVSIKLKQYVEAVAVTLEMNDDGTATEVAERPESENSPEPEEDISYTVQEGDTLWALAKHYYDDGNLYSLIAEANGIANPNLIYTGQTLIIPKRLKGLRP